MCHACPVVVACFSPFRALASGRYANANRCPGNGGGETLQRRGLPIARIAVGTRRRHHETSADTNSTSAGQTDDDIATAVKPRGQELTITGDAGLWF
eukprot:13355743-Alexandrium_andersonii.AAC.1